MSDQKSVLVVNQKAPYGSSLAREALDVVLTCSIFDLPVTLLFTGDSIFQLIKGQSGSEVGQKSLDSMLSALPMYDVENIYVTSDDLAKHGLTPDDLVLPVKSIPSEQIAGLIKQHSTVLTF